MCVFWTTKGSYIKGRGKGWRPKFKWSWSLPPSTKQWLCLQPRFWKGYCMVFRRHGWRNACTWKYALVFRQCGWRHALHVFRHWGWQHALTVSCTWTLRCCRLIHLMATCMHCFADRNSEIRVSPCSSTKPLHKTNPPWKMFYPYWELVSKRNPPEVI